MVNLLDLQVKDCFGPGIIALVSKRVDSVELVNVVHTVSIIRALGILSKDLTENKYRNRVIQDRFNSGELEIKLLKHIDLEGIDSPVVRDLYLRYYTQIEIEALKAQGMEVTNYHGNSVKFDIRSFVPKSKGTYGPQVYVKVSRGTKYFVQRAFKTMTEVQEYLASHGLLDILKDTKGIQKRYKEVEAPSNQLELLPL